MILAIAQPANITSFVSIIYSGLTTAFGSTLILGVFLLGLFVYGSVYAGLSKDAFVFLLMSLIGLLAFVGFIPMFVWIIALILGAVGFLVFWRVFT